MIIVMFSKDQKRFKRFTSLGPPRCSGDVGEDAYESLNDCQEKLHNLVCLSCMRLLILCTS